MRRLPALGIAVLFLATLGAAPSVLADSITIENYPDSSSQMLKLTPLGSGLLPLQAEEHVQAGFKAAEHGMFGERDFTEDLREGSSVSVASSSRAGFGGAFAASVGLTGGSANRSSSKGSVAGNGSGSVAANASGSVAGNASASASASASAAVSVPVAASGQAVVSPAAQGTAASQAALAEQGSALPSSAGNAAVSNFGGASSVVTPEPASLILLGSGLLFAGARARRLAKRSVSH